MTVSTLFNNFLAASLHTEDFGFLSGEAIASLAMQATATNPGEAAIQALINLSDEPETAMEAKVDTLSHIEHGKFHTESEGFLSEGFLSEKMCAFMGMQGNSLGAQTLGYQAQIVIYNVTNLRVLCNFLSRGTSTSNWTATSSEPGDFGPNNLDTDITEQIWKSSIGITTSLNLTTDTGVPQGVFVDTVAIINHNLTTSATVSLLGSNDVTFATVGVTIQMQVTEDNMYYIAPEFPTAQYRYWRFVINNVGNPDNFISIGTIIFGEADIFSGECITDQINYQLVDFADKIPTEGFTNVINSRSIKKSLGIEFQSIESRNRNFKLLRELFSTYRTTHKCLWIPTPSATDMEVTGRFAAFGKLVEIPAETHNSKGPLADYVNMSIDVDESL